MRSGALRRVRWGNVARVVGAVAAVGAIVVWPRLTPPAPSLPGGETQPLVVPAPRIEVKRWDHAPARPGERGLERRVRRGERRRREGAVAGEGAARRGGPVAGAEAVRGEAVAGGGEAVGGEAVGGESPHDAGEAVPAPPVDDPAQVEFGIEGGVGGGQ